MLVMNELRWKCCRVIGFINIVDTLSLLLSLSKKPIFSCLPLRCFVVQRKYELAASFHTKLQYKKRFRVFSTAAKNMMTDFLRGYESTSCYFFRLRPLILAFLLSLSDNFRAVVCSNAWAKCTNKCGIKEHDAKQTISVFYRHTAMETNRLWGRYGYSQWAYSWKTSSIHLY